MRVPVLIAFACTLSLATNASAQNTRPLQELLYADAKVGSLFFTFQFTTSAGYRITDHHGVGIGYHVENSSSSYSGTDWRGFGLDYRYATDNGFIFKAGGGLITSAGTYTDSVEDYVHTGGGHFVDFSADYQLRCGMTFGVYFTRAGGMKFDRYLYDGSYSPENAVYADSSVESMGNLGVSVGFAFPRRGR